MGAALHLVTDLPADAPAHPGRAHPLIAAVCGEPVLLAGADGDLVEFANLAPQVIAATEDVNACTPAQLALHWYVHHVAEQRRTGGKRTYGLAIDLGRWVLPFFDEMDANTPAPMRGAIHLRLLAVERIVHVMEGKLALPAATVAGDRLGRKGIECLWLTLPDAAKVVVGGPAALTAALACGQLATSTDPAGHRLVRTAHLRTAGLLDEAHALHGLDKDTAAKVLFPVKAAMGRARDLGVDLQGNYDGLGAVEPLPHLRARAPRTDAGYQSLATIAAICAHLSVLDQVVLWMLRLTGFRIGEGYGPLVRDLSRGPDGCWYLPIDKQGGQRMLERDPATGRLRWVDGKTGTKTGQSTRQVRLPGALGALLEAAVAVYHTAPDGTVDLDARLIPGIGKANASGASTFRRHLDAAITAAGAARFTPHDLRGMLTTDLMNASVPARVQEYYVGHLDSHRTVHEKYDDGVPLEGQQPATDALAALLEQAGIDDLVVPTPIVENWGTGTPQHARRDQITAALAARGWLAQAADPDDGTVLLPVRQVADRLGLSQTEVRRRCAEATLPARRHPWGTRTVWMVAEGDLDAYVAAQATMTIDALADELGLTYHQTRSLAGRLGALDQDRPRGTAITFTDEQADLVRRQVLAQRAAGTMLVDLPDAAARLRLPVGQVEKLVRSGHLEVVAGPTASRRRYVSVSSLEAFQATRTLPATTDDPLVVPVADARAALHLSRPKASDLIAMGVLAATTVRRRQCVLLSSALAYADQHDIPTARAALHAQAITRAAC